MAWRGSVIVIEPTLMSQRPPHEPAVMVSQSGRLELDLDAEPLGDLGRDVDVEALERAVRLQERLRRVVRVGRDRRASWQPITFASRSTRPPAAVDAAVDGAVDAAADGAVEAAADAAGLLEAPLDEQAATRMMAAVARLANRNRPSVKRMVLLLKSLFVSSFERGGRIVPAVGQRGWKPIRCVAVRNGASVGRSATVSSPASDRSIVPSATARLAMFA